MCRGGGNCNDSKGKTFIYPVHVGRPCIHGDIAGGRARKSQLDGIPSRNVPMAVKFAQPLLFQDAYVPDSGSMVLAAWPAQLAF